MAEASEAVQSTTRRISYDFRENPTVFAFSESALFLRMIMGPFGSGKSSGCIWDIVKKARLQHKNKHSGKRRVRWAVVRNTYKQLEDTTIKTVHKWFPPEFCGVYNVTKHNYNITKLPGLDIELLFRALDRPDHVKNLLSLELTGAWINEFREVPKDIFEALQGRVGRFPPKDEEGCAWWGVTGDSNPPDEDSYYEQLFEEIRPENLALFKQPSGLSDEAENLKYLPGGRNYYTNLAIGKDEEFVTVYVHGRYGFIPEGDAVATEYNEDTHRARVHLRPIERSLGVRMYDGGLFPTCIICQVTPAGQLQVLMTFRGENIGMRQLLENKVVPYLSSDPRFKTFKGWRDIGDPSLISRDPADSDQSVATVIEDTLETSFEPGPIDWGTRREGVKRALNHMISGRPWVLLDPREKVLHRALRGGWCYPKTADGKPLRDGAIKNIHSHPGDAFSEGVCVLLGEVKRKKKSEREMPEALTVVNSTVGY